MSHKMSASRVKQLGHNVPKFKKGHYGSSRSLIRRLGSALPIRPKYPLQIINHDKLSRSLVTEFEKDQSGWLGVNLGLQDLWYSGTEVLPPADEAFVNDIGPQQFQGNAVQRIANLEAELEQLRSKIACYALSSVQLLDEDQSHETSSSKVPPTPVPPPPPILPPLQSTTDGPVRDPVTPKPNPSLLSEIGSVRLKSVVKTSQGTAISREKGTPLDNDPAAIIARALQKKFAHLNFQACPYSGINDILDDDEDDMSPFGTPS